MTVSTLAPMTRALQAANPDASAARISALLHLLQAWCLGLTGRPLFLPDLIVDADEGTITADQSIATDVVTALTLDETVAVEAVVTFYSHHTDDQLRALIKVDVSWPQFEGHLRETPTRTVVDDAGLRQTYALRSMLTGTAPVVTTSREATDAEAAAAGLAVLEQWRRGLNVLRSR